MKEKHLSFWEASSIIAGYGVGGGIMAVPYLAEKNGLLITFLIMVCAYGLSVLLHLMIAELCSGENEESTQIVELFRKYLFRGRFEKPLSWMFFALLALILFSTMAAYVVGAGEILVSLIAVPLWSGKVLFYLIAAGVVFFGLKVLGISEKYAIGTIALIFLVLAGTSLAHSMQPVALVKPIGNATLALYGMVMFCFGSFFSIPQAVEGLNWNKKLIPKAVVTGIGINLMFVLVVVFFALATSETVTEMAIIGWAGALGGWASILGSVFIFLAMLTTYWSVSYALVVIVQERVGWSERTSWLVSTLPTLLIALVGAAGFLDLMRLVGGGIAIVVAVLLIPAYRAARVHRAKDPGTMGWNIGKWGATPLQVLVIVAYLLTAVGSFIEI